MPYVVDGKGKASKSLPRPGANDDPVLAEAARAQFTAFKREIKSVATDQIRRLNRAMVTGRRWSGDEFSQYLLGHPLVIHLVRRLLWASFGENGAPTTVFRVAEDNTFADVEGSRHSIAGRRDRSRASSAHPRLDRCMVASVP
ncbi:hypothetical protein B2J88_46420 [Rhodococcus sp. SRB_17]|nr:hypothetical protein [Rhodococcus sp. SRB_17]